MKKTTIWVLFVFIMYAMLIPVVYMLYYNPQSLFYRIALWSLIAIGFGARFVVGNSIGRRREREETLAAKRIAESE